MRDVVMAFENGNLRPFFDALDDDIVWRSASSRKSDALIFGGEYVGRAAVIALISKLLTAYCFREYRPRDISSKGEIVWGLFDVEGTYLPFGEPELNRRSIAFQSALCWRVRDGRIVECKSFFDTAGLIAQQAA
jgi:ketosteroid isomerase-like protein